MTHSSSLPQPRLLTYLLHANETLQTLQAKLDTLPRHTSAKEHRLLLEDKMNAEHRLRGLETTARAAETVLIHECSPVQFGRIMQGLLDQVEDLALQELQHHFQCMLVHQLLTALEAESIGKGSVHGVLSLLLSLASWPATIDGTVSSLARQALCSTPITRLAKTFEAEAVLDKKSRQSRKNSWQGAFSTPADISEVCAKREIATTDLALEYWIMSQAWVDSAFLMQQSMLLDPLAQETSREGHGQGAPAAEDITIDQEVMFPSPPTSPVRTYPNDNIDLDLPAAPSGALHSRRQAMEAEAVEQELDAQRLIQIYTGKPDSDRYDKARRQAAWDSDESSSDSSVSDDECESSVAISDDEARDAVAEMLAAARATMTSSNDTQPDAGDKSIDELIQEARDAMQAVSPDSGEIQEDGFT